jgi:hypothetical protein
MNWDKVHREERLYRAILQGYTPASKTVLPEPTADEVEHERQRVQRILNLKAKYRQQTV